MNTNFTFPELEYKRPDFKAIKKSIAALTKKLKKAKSYEQFRGVIEEFESVYKPYQTATTLSHIRNTLDTTDKFYEGEQAYINKVGPTMGIPMLSFYKTALKSKFIPQLTEEFGPELVMSIKRSVDSFKPKLVILMQQEAVLCTRFQKLIASAQIDFDGQKLNLYGIQKYFEHDDREVRKAAAKAYSGFFEAHEAELEEIFDKLVKIRHKMGRKMGYENFIPLGYINQSRSDYGQAEVAAFREQVLRELTPFCQKLYELQAQRLGIDSVKFYDEKRVFADGNADPVGTEEELVEKARAMYHDFSPETAEFIDFMIDHRLMDLTNRPGKAATGYMTILSDYKAPFVFSCFNGTAGDVHVLTHELGHAFAGYSAMLTQPTALYWSSGTDIAEIHSMTMEQFSYPYAESFFGENADKFRFSHLQEALTFVPFGVAVDEFQHIVYENPNLTPKQRTEEWRKLEKKYMPWRNWDGDEFFERGGWWYHKIHIFLYPFYYINYTLTTMGALELGARAVDNREQAWADYLALCRAGGSLNYLGLLKVANLSVPFEEGTVAKSTEYAKNRLLENSVKFAPAE